MAAQVDARCSCARDDVEASSNGRCLRCGKLLRESFAVVATPDRNAGVHHTSPSGAYRSPVEPFDAARSVAVIAAAREPEPEPPAIHNLQGAGPETATPPTPPPSPLAVEDQPAAPAPALGRPTREWIDQTRALGEELLTAADEEDRRADAARAQAATHATEAVRLRKSAAIFTQLLRAVDVPIAPDPAPASTAADSPPPTGVRWSRNSAVQVDACIDCGRADVPHLANGRCSRCDYTWRKAGQPKGAA